MPPELIKAIEDGARELGFKGTLRVGPVGFKPQIREIEPKIKPVHIHWELDPDGCRNEM